MLIVFGGLPGTGKTTLSRMVAHRRAATLLRIDTIEQALRSAEVLASDVGAAGYVVAQAIAEANLGIGRVVVADCVNPVAASRAGWRAVARRAAVDLVEIEVRCSDPREHRRRVEERESDIPGLAPPGWQAVERHIYEPWPEAHVVVDTAHRGVPETMEVLERLIDEAASRSATAPFAFPAKPA